MFRGIQAHGCDYRQQVSGSLQEPDHIKQGNRQSRERSAVVGEPACPHYHTLFCLTYGTHSSCRRPPKREYGFQQRWQQRVKNYCGLHILCSCHERCVAVVNRWHHMTLYVCISIDSWPATTVIEFIDTENASQSWNTPSPYLLVLPRRIWLFCVKGSVQKYKRT